MLLSLISFFFLFASPILAQTDFTITENIEYNLDLQGNASVTHQVDIQNNFSQIYPKEYQIQIHGLPLSNLNASDNQGNILQSFSSQNENTTINLKFSHPNLGKNQITSFKMSYHISELAKHKGKTWEISLPQSANDAISQSQITLITPSEYGNLSFSSIKANFKSAADKNVLNFQNNTPSKILIIFGNYQLFNFKLSYYLKNPSADTVSTSIALIPETRTQNVFYQSISPAPQDISLDSDGNWLAKYQLSPNQEIEVIAEGQVKTGVHSLEKTVINSTSYLQEQAFWPINNPEIKDLSSTLNTPKSIYRYVVDHLDYNFDRLNSASRLGALAALSNPQNSLCTEFTDLFVTLARSRGIPAREIEGYAYSNNSKIKPTNSQSDILHAWPEYYDSQNQIWKAVDPTWEKTTNGIDYFDDLDLNHITFVIHGQNSELPLPPGSYKNPQGEKSVFIDFANTEISSETTLPTLSLQKNTLLIKNSSPSFYQDLNISLPELNFTHKIDKLLPYSSQSISLKEPSFFTSLLSKYQRLNLHLETSSGQNMDVSLKYPRHFLNLTIVIVTSILLLALSGIIITSKHHEKNT